MSSVASFNTTVEKWDSSKIGGKWGGSKGKQGPAIVRALHNGRKLERRAHPTHNQVAAHVAEVAGMLTAAYAALVQKLTMALSTSRWFVADKGGKR
jgi:hypothetical protein